MYFIPLLSISQITKNLTELNTASGNSNISTFWTWPEMHLWKTYPEINILFAYCLFVIKKEREREREREREKPNLKKYI